MGGLFLLGVYRQVARMKNAIIINHERLDVFAIRQWEYDIYCVQFPLHRGAVGFVIHRFISVLVGQQLTQVVIDGRLGKRS